MSSTSRMECKIERTIPASPNDVFDAWLSPKTPGTPWNMAEDLILQVEPRGLFYWLVRGNAHYGRFVQLVRGERIQHTWMSPNTLGIESLVTVTFRKACDATVMTLVHSGLPDSEGGRSHEKGWSYFLDALPRHFKEESHRGQ